MAHWLLERQIGSVHLLADQSSSSSRRTDWRVWVLRLDPGRRAARTINRVPPLRHDAFEPELAGVLEHNWPIRSGTCHADVRIDSGTAACSGSPESSGRAHCRPLPLPARRVGVLPGKRTIERQSPLTVASTLTKLRMSADHPFVRSAAHTQRKPNGGAMPPGYSSRDDRCGIVRGAA